MPCPVLPTGCNITELCLCLVCRTDAVVPPANADPAPAPAASAPAPAPAASAPPKAEEPVPAPAAVNKSEPEKAEPEKVEPTPTPAPEAVKPDPSAPAKEADEKKAEAAPADLSQYQPALNAAMAKRAEEVADRQAEIEHSLMAPIDGISLETYATLCAAIARDSTRYEQIIGTHQLTPEKWESIQNQWQARMKADAATGSVATAYGKYYLAAGTGQFGASGQAAAASMSNEGVLVGNAPAANAEPCTFERYCEILGAQSAWAALGLDVNEKLRSVLNMNANDFANMAGYWSSKVQLPQLSCNAAPHPSLPHVWCWLVCLFVVLLFCCLDDVGYELWCSDGAAHASRNRKIHQITGRNRLNNPSPITHHITPRIRLLLCSVLCQSRSSRSSHLSLSLSFFPHHPFPITTSSSHHTRWVILLCCYLFSCVVVTPRWLEPQRIVCSRALSLSLVLSSSLFLTH